MSVDVKICGVCTAADARMAASAGAAWIGVILAPGRRRTCTPEQAQRIFEGVAVRRAGVFVDAEPGDVAAVACMLGLDAIQLHGEETREYVRELRLSTDAEIWKAVRVRSPLDVTFAIEQQADDVDALLLDGWSSQGHGGVGAAFDWKAVAGAGVVRPGVRLIVAGGLNAGNVGRAVSLLRPDVVDVSSGVEEELGRKSADLVRAFIAAACGRQGA